MTRSITCAITNCAAAIITIIPIPFQLFIFIIITSLHWFSYQRKSQRMLFLLASLFLTFISTFHILLAIVAQLLYHIIIIIILILPIIQ